jgi:hypothetical protein
MMLRRRQPQRRKAINSDVAPSLLGVDTTVNDLDAFFQAMKLLLPVVSARRRTTQEGLSGVQVE